MAPISRAAADRQRLQTTTGLSKTDIVNRAVPAYEFFESRMRMGHLAEEGGLKCMQEIR